jgi:hypothetical protein
VQQVHQIKDMQVALVSNQDIIRQAVAAAQGQSGAVLQQLHLTQVMVALEFHHLLLELLQNALAVAVAESIAQVLEAVRQVEEVLAFCLERLLTQLQTLVVAVVVVVLTEPIMVAMVVRA